MIVNLALLFQVIGEKLRANWKPLLILFIAMILYVALMVHSDAYSGI